MAKLEVFDHLVRSSSGLIKKRIIEQYGHSLRAEEIDLLATIIYYPEEKLSLIEASEKDLDQFYNRVFGQLIAFTKHLLSNYHGNGVDRLLKFDHGRMIIELLVRMGKSESNYTQSFIDSTLRMGLAKNLIIDLS